MLTPGQLWTQPPSVPSVAYFPILQLVIGTMICSPILSMSVDLVKLHWKYKVYINLHVFLSLHLAWILGPNLASFIPLNPANIEHVNFSRLSCINTHINFLALSTLQQLYCLPNFHWDDLGEFDWSSTAGWSRFSSCEFMWALNMNTRYYSAYYLESWPWFDSFQCYNHIFFCCMHPSCNKHHSASFNAEWTSSISWGISSQPIWTWILENMVARFNYRVDTKCIYIYLWFILSLTTATLVQCFCSRNILIWLFLSTHSINQWKSAMCEDDCRWYVSTGYVITLI